jgi:hypothetical protein
MGPEDFRKMIEGHQVATPFVIEAEGGRSYTISDPTDIHIPNAYPNTVILCLRERGLILLRLDEIESLHPEPKPLPEQRAIPDSIDSTQEEADLGPEDYRKMIAGKEVATPYVIVTMNC